ncbi:MAG: bile acid:sodium symporter family protein [Chromatiales bacterium]|jgi:BASS family bile acid:Na+ symporter
MTLVRNINRLFPLWAVMFAGLGYLFPAFWSGLRDAIVPLLVMIMFSMGLTLTVWDFRRAFCHSRLVGIGVTLQYVVMPLAAWLLALLFGLSDELTIGLVLVGATAGGTASNVITYLARGDLALSITMTLSSSLLAIVLMPWLTWLYVGQRVEVPVLDMLQSLLLIVLLPVLGGVIVNAFLSARIRQVEPLFPLFSIFAIAVIIAIVVGLNAGRFAEVGPLLLLVVILHNAIGLLSGFSVARWLGYDSVVARTIAIEVGMQNSGLSVALALQFFTPLAALPGALFSIWHNLSGALFATRWQRQQPSDEVSPDPQ